MHMDYYDFIVNVYSALGLGLLIGIEREFRQHPAGLRTNALVCVGSALFMSLTFLLQKEGGALLILVGLLLTVSVESDFLAVE
ncbi:MAG: MgtC/SapB family protein [Gemmataceae bacterium]|nr:MgtC/SapB family protein [Gemmataceae bacterium]